MWWVTRDSVIHCDHDGRVTNVASQTWLTVGGIPVLVEPDPQGRGITACPNYGATVKPCTSTSTVKTGYSGLLKVDGHRVVLSNLDGLTDGTPPMSVHHKVRDARQSHVGADR